jgi:hypothetical protein
MVRDAEEITKAEYRNASAARVNRRKPNLPAMITGSPDHLIT